MLTDAGGGYSNWKKTSPSTRWRDRPLARQLGQRSSTSTTSTSNIHWSVGPANPIGRGPSRYEAIARGKVEYRRHDGGVETLRKEIAVSAGEDDAEVRRRVRITNLSRARRRFEVTTYSEVVLAGAGADMAHRAFSNLFVQTELQPASSAVLATRRPRSSGETPPWLVHLTAVSEHKWQAPSFETDRAKFIGRGRSASNPVAMDKSGPLSGTAGAVLDPIVSIRRMVELGPGESAEIDSVMGVAATQTAAQALIDRYKERKFVTRVFETAWTQSQVHALRSSLGHVKASDAQLFNRLAEAALDLRRARALRPPGMIAHMQGAAVALGLRHLRRPADRDRHNHRYWRHGAGQQGHPGPRVVAEPRAAVTDLVILIPREAAGYRMHLMEQVTGLLATSVEAQLVDKPGGVFVRGAENMPEDDRVLLQAVARLTFNDRAGNLDDQADRITYDPPRIPRFQPARAPRRFRFPPARRFPRAASCSSATAWAASPVTAANTSSTSSPVNPPPRRGSTSWPTGPSAPSSPSRGPLTRGSKTPTSSGSRPGTTTPSATPAANRSTSATRRRGGSGRRRRGTPAAAGPTPAATAWGTPPSSTTRRACSPRRPCSSPTTPR